jgi:hypothetical protein
MTIGESFGGPYELVIAINATFRSILISGSYSGLKRYVKYFSGKNEAGLVTTRPALGC